MDAYDPNDPSQRQPPPGMPGNFIPSEGAFSGMPRMSPAPVAPPMVSAPGIPSMSPGVGGPERFTSRDGQSRITDFGRNTVTYLTGEAARNYNRATGYGEPMTSRLEVPAAAPRPAFSVPSMPTFSLPGASMPRAAERPLGVPGEGTIGKFGSIAPKMSPEARAAWFRSAGLRGAAADWASRAAHRAGAAGGPQDLGAFLASGVDAEGFRGQQQLAAQQKFAQELQGELFKSRLGVEEAAAKKRAELAAPYELAGIDPRTGKAAEIGDESAKRRAELAALGIRTTGDLTANQLKLLELAQAARDEQARAAGQPTASERAAMRSVDYSAGAPGRLRGETPEQTAERLKKEDLIRAGKEAGEFQKTQKELAPLDLDTEGLPVTTVRNGIVYEKRGGRWERAGSAPREGFGGFGGIGGQPVVTTPQPTQAATPAAPAAAAPAQPPVFDPTKVYTQGGRRFKTPDGGKTFVEVK